ncbi:ladderlectin-like [Betta splendens]|uniref:Ladderlectin-like n=1 Tax=Betta splendens TaxID=158456 RepID=A0A6P7M0T8_BETSP|nr:ladderlectin-like [Betta splendens]
MLFFQTSVAMKTLLLVSVLLCAALMGQAATVAPGEAVAVQQEDEPAPHSDAADGPPFLPQVRVQFCLDGWLSFRGNCYFLANHVETWGGAERFCAGFQANLASAHNVLEQNFLQRLVKTGGHSFAWIGGFYFQNFWRWEDGSVFNYQNWYSLSSPDRLQCVQLNSQESRGWSSQSCTTRFPFVCQMNPDC